MKQSIIEFIKHNRFVYNIYYYGMSVLVNFLKLLVRPDDRLILFVVYGGKGFAESPRCIYEKMLSDPRFNGYKLVWAFKKPEDFVEVDKKVKIDTLSYFITALKARVWVSNEGVERALNFKGKHTFYFYTTHTIYPKYVGLDAVGSGTFVSKSSGKAIYDMTCAQSEEERDVQSRAFNMDKKDILVIGYPKNDKIANATTEDRVQLRKKLGIPEGKIAILYAPTFREDFKENPIDFKKWQERLGDEYILMYRAHHYMASKVSIDNNSDFIKDFSYYPDNTDLLIAADVLISDFSGIFVEFGVQDKLMFSYPYDYDEYTKYRGLYFDVRDVLPGGKLNEDEFLEYIKNGDVNEQLNKVNAFKKRFVSTYGNATNLSVNAIYDKIVSTK